MSRPNCEQCYILRRPATPADWRVRSTDEQLCEACREQLEYAKDECELIVADPVSLPAVVITTKDTKENLKQKQEDEGMAKCKCGCGEPAQGRSEYRYGHKPTGEKAAKKVARVRSDGGGTPVSAPSNGKTQVEPVAADSVVLPATVVDAWLAKLSPARKAEILAEELAR